jgi:hypothetical protein
MDPICNTTSVHYFFLRRHSRWKRFIGLLDCRWNRGLSTAVEAPAAAAAAAGRRKLSFKLTLINH